MKKILINLLVIIGISVLLGFLFLKVYLPMYTNHGESVSVPDLSGYTYDEGVEILNRADLKYEVSLDSGFNTDLKTYAILKQIPQANAQVKTGKTIYITLNAKNPPMLKMPNLVNTHLKNVQEILANMGLERGDIVYVPDIASNVVLEQKYRGVKITEGFEVPKGARIDLVVGDGLGNQILEVPNLKGMEEVDAEFLILGSSLRVGSKYYVDTDSVGIGKILRQSPPANTKVKTGEIVDLWIAKDNF
ncbi:PASTA domain-containing protein [Algoriphagus sp. NG3]|uniref:PASTA domain-containing protein n=1 Tax=Algoriphagus sp. NG3 TaxID=3097546 RepID=UPI002A820D49|nr:PASTA domain-containing protein [Algoriphagus sp. NG3]WPR77640.1 PASTA domain-containing protein [Algoriphagus sp. NG3]